MTSKTKTHNVNAEFFACTKFERDMTGEEFAHWLRQVADLFESGCLPEANVTIDIKAQQ